MDAATMKNTGGPAFPRNYVPGSVTTDGSGRQYHTPFVPAQEGMTLRDYFAAAALQGILASTKTTDDSAVVSAYLVADAMIAERERIDKYPQMQREHKTSAVQMQGTYGSFQTLWEKK